MASYFLRGFLVATIVIGTVTLVPMPAYASCSGGSFNVIGKDSARTQDVKGNGVTVYVNNIQGTESGVTRAGLVATNINTNFVEFGWRLGTEDVPVAGEFSVTTQRTDYATLRPSCDTFSACARNAPTRIGMSR